MDFSKEMNKPLFVVRESDGNTSFPTPNQINGNKDIKKRLASLYDYLAKHLGIQSVPKVKFTKNKKNSENPFGMTGHYDPQLQTITIFTTDRHDTDILRTFAHEVIHHWQNERGTLTPQTGGAEHYAQNDPNLRKREMEAYLFGNILFRDWQDENRNGPPSVQPFLPQPLNENLVINPSHLKPKVVAFVDNLVHDGVFTSYNRALSSGQMNPVDFANDLVHKILNSVQTWVKTINDRGDWENDEGGMIKEIACKNCGNKCDPSMLGEVAMGAVECPNCKSTMDQEGNVYGRRI